MRTWLSFRTPIRGIRVGAGASLSAARVYAVSATGQKVWRIGSTKGLLARWSRRPLDPWPRINFIHDRDRLREIVTHR
jgi:hypothetical protein